MISLKGWLLILLQAPARFVKSHCSQWSGELIGLLKIGTTLLRVFPFFLRCSWRDCFPFLITFHPFLWMLRFQPNARLHRTRLSKSELLTVLVEEGRIEQLKKRFRNSLGSEFRYEFSQGDLEKVQVLLNELRTEVAASQKLEEGHKARLLKRLEALQAELHKKISDLDKFWGLVGDASVVMAKIGTNAKPIVDRVREVADIVWRTQTRAEELPSGTTLPQIGRAPGEGPPSV